MRQERKKGGDSYVEGVFDNGGRSYRRDCEKK